MDKLTLKPLSNTQWESRVKSVKAIKLQACKIKLALLALYKSNTNDAITRSEAFSLSKSFASFEFLLSLVVRYQIAI